MHPIRHLATLLTLLVLPMHVSAHAGHGWEGLSHESQHLLSALVAVLAVAAIATLFGVRKWWRSRLHLRSQPQQRTDVKLAPDAPSGAPAKSPCALN